MAEFLIPPRAQSFRNGGDSDVCAYVMVVGRRRRRRSLPFTKKHTHDEQKCFYFLFLFIEETKNENSLL
jgi:hypothetical protein